MSAHQRLTDPLTEGRKLRIAQMGVILGGRTGPANAVSFPILSGFASPIGEKKTLLGTFHYDSNLKVDFEDRVLAHIQIVAGAKLRRGESFYFSWRDDEAVGNGRTTVWLHPALPLVYKYFGSKMPRINPAWIQTLTESANSNGGLQLVPEPDPTTYPTDPAPRAGAK